jgi:hypothetical protein
MNSKADILREINRLLMSGKHEDRKKAKRLTKDLAAANKEIKKRENSDLNNQKSLF